MKARQRWIALAAGLAMVAVTLAATSLVGVALGVLMPAVVCAIAGVVVKG